MSERNLLPERRHFEVPLTIGVISDTHIYSGSQRTLSDEFLNLFRRFSCDLIVHAGDCNNLRTLQALAEVAPVLAVTGNNDQAEVREIAPRELTFTAGKTQVAIVHGDGGRSARAVARIRFGGRADLVIYGHSHIPMIERSEGTTYFNPGSATDRRWHEYFGLGLIHVNEAGFRPELVLFKDPRELVSIKPEQSKLR